MNNAIIVPTEPALIEITLDQLRPFDLNPRFLVNPKYAEIKESIRHRYLDSPPSITHRPDEDFFIIANGGNTRLSILNELYQETHDSKFWKISCQFKPWPTSETITRGNLKCLVCHLAENDVRGKLTFIERALAIVKVKELYQVEESSDKITQQNLALKLNNDGYPIIQQHISVMESALKHLYPYIPDTLFSGLGRRQIIKLLSLRSSSEKIWKKYRDNIKEHIEFNDVFAEVITNFNGSLSVFSLNHIQDELFGVMSQYTGLDYNYLVLNLNIDDQKKLSLIGTTPESVISDSPMIIASEQEHHTRIESVFNHRNANEETEPLSTPATERIPRPDADMTVPVDLPEDTLPATIGMTNQPTISPVIREHHADTAAHEREAKPSDDDAIWTINPLFDYPESLSSIADRLAWDIATTCDIENLIQPINNGIGFEILPLEENQSNDAKIIWQILAFLSGQDLGNTSLWQSLLTGTDTDTAVWSDEFVINLFKLIRTIRRIREQLNNGGKHDPIN